MEYLVGYTGFVGSNLAESHTFDGLFNSKNIEEAYGKNPDLLVYAGVRAEMFLANHEPEKDLAAIQTAIENIKKINPKKLVLISTIAVYDNPVGVDEDSEIDEEKLSAYGYNRYLLEKWVQTNYKDSLIVRLPALYGKNLKKNFIYDYIHLIPKFLNQEKYTQLASQNDSLTKYYTLLDNGLYGCKNLTDEERVELKEYFKSCGFSALNFTDSRAVYQFYDLKYLWRHIENALEQGITKLNIATEPIAVSELYETLKGEEFVNHLSKPVFTYDYHTKYDSIYGGKNGYQFTKEDVVSDIKEFMKEYGE